MGFKGLKFIAIVLAALAAFRPAMAEEVTMSTRQADVPAISSQIVTMLGQENSALRRVSTERLIALVSPVRRRGTGRAPAAATFPYSEASIAAMPRARGGRQWQCLSEALYFEARGESLRGLFGVAEVILNRVDSPAFPNTICGVVNQGASRLNACQFSYNCDGKAEVIAEPAAWERVGKVARIMMDGGPRTLTKGATYYHAASVRPRWASSFQRTARIGEHYFYRDPRYAAN